MKWGGKRKGAGRKVPPEDEKQSLSIMIVVRLVEWLAQVSGKNRGRYINFAIQSAKDNNLVLVVTDKLQPELEDISEIITDWTFKVGVESVTFHGNYDAVLESAIAAALERGVRVIELVGCLKE